MIETREVRQRMNDRELTRTELHHLVLELCTALDEERQELWKAEQLLLGQED